MIPRIQKRKQERKRTKERNKSKERLEGSIQDSCVFLTGAAGRRSNQDN